MENYGKSDREKAVAISYFSGPEADTEKEEILSETCRAFLEAIPVIVFIKNDNFRYVFANKAARNYLKKNKEEIIGKTDFDLMPGKAATACRKSDVKALETGKVVIGEEHIGDKIFETIKLLVKLNNGKFGIAGLVKDISENIKAREKAEKVDREKTEFIGIASHQLKNPLSGMILAIDMILKGKIGRIKNEQKIHLRGVRADIKKMSDLIDTLLNISRIETGALVVKPQYLPLHKILDATLDELKPRIENKKLKLEKSYARNLPPAIKLDEKILSNALMNIICNSIKYTPKNGKIKVETYRQKDSRFIIAVSDTGPGIPKELQPKIFTRLFRASDMLGAKGDRGSGLGLYIAKGLISIAGGRIWFESPALSPSAARLDLPEAKRARFEKGKLKKNKGTIFYVSFPLSGMRAK